MDISHLEAFIAVVDCGSFTVAARRLNLTQSAISQKIAALESKFGAALFIRTSRGVRISYSGEKIMPLVIEISRSWNKLISLTKTTKPMEGRLLIAASGPGHTLLWSKFYREFGMNYPDLRLDLHETSSTLDSLNQVQTGGVDIGLAVKPRKLGDFFYQTLGVQQAVLCAPKAHPLTRKKTVTKKKLAGERFILLNPSASIRWLADQFFRQGKFKPNIVLESNDLSLIRTMIEIGYGIGFLPNWCIQDAVDSQAIKPIKIAGKPMCQEFGIVSRHCSPSGAIKAFIDFCVQHRYLLPDITQGYKPYVQ